MKGSTLRRCYCTDPGTGRELGADCPDLKARKRRHGTYGYAVRLETTAGRRLVKRWGFPRDADAEEALGQVQQLVKLAGGEAGTARRIGDLIVERTRRGGQLPTVEDVRRKLGAGADLAAPDATVAEYLNEWLAGKRKLKESVRRSYRQHLDHYLTPILGGIPRDRLSVEHISGMFDTIEEWNAEIVAAREDGREPHLPDDKRTRRKVVGIATQHRILATLKNAYNAAVKRPGMINWNPCLAVELPPETRDEARVWAPDQVAEFLAAASDDRLGVLYRIILLRGLRRGEGCGLRWTDLDLDTGHATIAQTVLQLGGRITFDTPKTRAGKRVVSLDAETTRLLKAHRTAQRRERLAAGELYQDDFDLVFCRENGRPLAPDRVSLHFKELTIAAGLPAIKLHEARHTAATLGLEAGLDIKVVSDQLGHSTTRITQDLYTHVRRAVHDAAAEQVVALLPERARRETGS